MWNLSHSFVEVHFKDGCQVFAPVFRLQYWRRLNAAAAGSFGWFTLMRSNENRSFCPRWSGDLKCQISSGVDRIAPKRRAEMFGLVFILIPLTALDLTFPTMPLSSPQSWHRPPGTQQQITCVGVGGRGAPEQEDASVPAHETKLQL